MHSSAVDVFEQLIWVLIAVSQIDMCNEVLPRGFFIFLKSATDKGIVSYNINARRETACIASSKCIIRLIY